MSTTPIFTSATCLTGAPSSLTTSNTYGIYNPNTNIAIGYAAHNAGSVLVNSNGSLTWQQPTSMHYSQIVQYDKINIRLEKAFTTLANKVTKYTSYMTLPVPIYGESYFIVTDSDFTDSYRLVAETEKLLTLGNRAMIFALDYELNRLEFCSICPDIDPKSNLGALVDDSFSVLPDKTNYISSLYCRYLPIVSFGQLEVTDCTDDPNMLAVTAVPVRGAGILPIMHLANIVFGGLIKVSQSEASNIFNNLTQELVILDKQCFPPVQPYFSPEYGYLTLDPTKELKKIARLHTDYTEQGLIILLCSLCISQADPTVLATQLIEHISLNQRIANPSDFAVMQIKRIIETMY